MKWWKNQIVRYKSIGITERPACLNKPNIYLTPQMFYTVRKKPNNLVQLTNGLFDLNKLFGCHNWSILLSQMNWSVSANFEWANKSFDVIFSWAIIFVRKRFSVGNCEDMKFFFKAIFGGHFWMKRFFSEFSDYDTIVLMLRINVHGDMCSVESFTFSRFTHGRSFLHFC